jgi:polar amino acid transport system substrate-binding protein
MQHIIALGLWAALLLGGINPAQGAARIVNVGWDYYPPFQIDPAAARTGIDFEMLTLLLSGSDVQLHFKKMPWSRQLAMIRDGGLDLILSASITDDRKNYAIWSQPYRNETVALLAHGQYNDMKLEFYNAGYAEFRIGLLRDFALTPEAEGYIHKPNFNIEYSNNMDSLMAKFQSRRINAVIDDEAVIYEKARENQFKVRTLSLLSVNPVRIMLANKSKLQMELRKRINQKLQDPTIRNQLQKILHRYNQ